MLVQLEHQLVRVAEKPVLTRLEGLDHRMLRGVVVLGGVLVLRTVAAADVAALHAEAEVDPDVTHLEAFLAAVAAGRDVQVGTVEVRAGVGHQPRYPSTTPGSRTVASLGSRPALRRARRWWSRSQAWSKVTSMSLRRCRSSGLTEPWDSRSNSWCSSWARALMRLMISWSSIRMPPYRERSWMARSISMVSAWPGPLAARHTVTRGKGTGRAPPQPARNPAPPHTPPPTHTRPP